MKIISILLATLTLAFSRAEANTHEIFSLHDIETILNQLGIPWEEVTAVNEGGFTKGYAYNYVTFAAFSGTGATRGLYSTGSSYLSSNGGASWTWDSSSGTSVETNAATGLPIYLKTRTDGTLKPVQIKSDATAINVFDSNGYYYKLGVADVVFDDASQSKSLNFIPQQQGH